MSGFPFSVSLGFKRVLHVSLLLVSCAMFSSCDMAKNYQKVDRAFNMEMQDFRDGIAERLPELDEKKAGGGMSSIPSLQPYVSANGVESMKPMPLVSVSVNQSVPLRDVLFELAEQADYDLELDPRIHGSIIFTARNKPFDVVVDRISDIAGLRYKFDGTSLRVEVDEPYLQTYKLDYLSYVRSNKSSVATNVSVVTGEGADTGSAFSSSSESISDFWAELEVNLDQILGGASSGALKTDKDPRISAVEQNPDVQAVSPSPATGDKAADGSTSVAVTPPEAVLKVESLPVTDDSSKSKKTAKDKNAGLPTFSLNKQAGLINVFANEKTQKQVKKYLDDLRRSVTSQVLVEAKIFEVDLSDEYITGIDWSALNLFGNKGFAGYMNTSGTTLINTMVSAPGTGVFTGPTGSALDATSNVVVGYAGGDIQAFLQAMSAFGTVRALASPRLTVLNNQSAVLNVATNRVYFELEVDSEPVTVGSGTGTKTTVSSTIKSVPEGVLVNVIPSINLEDRTISMALRPTVTRIVGSKDDPGVTYVASLSSSTADLVSSIPEVNVQEIDTVVKVRSGQPIVMGGLLQDRASTSQEGVPVLDEVPVVGSLFRKHNDLVQKTELVIFLKATLLDMPEDSIHNTDRDLYKAFSGDRRPFDL